MDDLDQLLSEIRAEPTRDPKNTYPRAGQELMIGPLEKDELKSPNKNIGLGDAPYVNRDGGVITFESTGSKVGKGEVPNDVQARYRKFVNHAKQTGKPIPYLEYNGKRWYYQSRGKSLTNLETKLKVVADKTAREHAKTPTLEEYREVFGNENGTRLFNEEQEAMKKLTPGRKNTKTPEGYSRGHIRADGEGGRWHTRNLKLENTIRNAQQRQQVLDPEVENKLMVGGNTNKEFIATQGPKTTPLQTQAILQGEPSVSREALGKPRLEMSAKGGSLRMLRTGAMVAGGLGALGIIGDVVQAKEGVEDIVSGESEAEKVAGGLNTAGAAIGLAGFAANPVTAIPAIVLSGYGGAIKTRINQDRVVKQNFRAADPKVTTAVDPYENQTQIIQAPKKKKSWFGLPDLGLTEALGIN